MPSHPYLTAPIKTDKMPPGIPYIIGNEAAERFNFYGMRAILFVFMTKYLVDGAGKPAPMNEDDGNFWYHVFIGTVYFLPVFGSIVSDAFWGKYKTIIWLSLVYCAGSVVLALDHTRLGLTCGLTLIAIGSGGIKPCVSAHVGDQFGAGNRRLLPRAFSWFYFSINSGSSLAYYLVPILLAKYGAGPAFGLPAVLMLLATFVFWSGRYKFAHIPPGGRTFFRENFTPEGWRVLGRLALIYLFMTVFWALWDQSGSEWVAQAEKMDLHLSFFGFSFEILPSQIGVINALLTVAFIPLFQYVIYPVVNRVWRLTDLRKIGIGIFVIGISFLISAWIESEIHRGVKLNIGWQLPAYVLLTASEVMASITALEFAYTQAPKAMKSMIMSLYLLAIAFGNYFAAGMHWVISHTALSSWLNGTIYYSFYAVLSMSAAVVFVFFARRYREKTYLQGGTPAGETEAEAISST